MPNTRELYLRLLVIALATFLLTAASLEFYNITWGTGEWLGLFSLKWFVAFVLFELFCILCLEGTILAAWRNEKFNSALDPLWGNSEAQRFSESTKPPICLFTSA